MTKKVDVIVDLQFGSTGKGVLAGLLAATGEYTHVVAANMPNAGHTTINASGRKWIHKCCPNGIEVTKCIMIAAGSVFSPAQLSKELLDAADLLEGKRIMIHEAAGILKHEHKEKEQATQSRISSTMQGSAEALIDKIRRQDGAIARDNRDLLARYGLDKYLVTQAEWLAELSMAERILVEGSQGYSLGLSQGFYPYCTSRECTAARVIADTGIPITWVDRVFGVARVHPIRVGNTADGFSGDHYPDQTETSWAEVGQPEEFTTVTKRVRRIFTFSMQQFWEAVFANGCTDVFLNFANYDVTKAAEIIREVNSVEEGLISVVGVGPCNLDVLTVEEFERGDYAVNYL